MFYRVNPSKHEACKSGLACRSPSNEATWTLSSAIVHSIKCKDDAAKPAGISNEQCLNAQLMCMLLAAPSQYGGCMDPRSIGRKARHHHTADATGGRRQETVALDTVGKASNGVRPWIVGLVVPSQQVFAQVTQARRHKLGTGQAYPTSGHDGECYSLANSSVARSCRRATPKPVARSPEKDGYACEKAGVSHDRPRAHAYILASNACAHNAMRDSSQHARLNARYRRAATCPNAGTRRGGSR